MPPLCIIQARYHSTRLPGKLLLTLQGETLIARAWRVACEVFGAENCVVAIPSRDLNSRLGDELERIKATVFASDADEDDVLTRFYECASLNRSHADDIIFRLTPDDWRRDPAHMVRASQGVRHPVQLGGERCTLAQLAYWHTNTTDPETREHIGRLFDPTPIAPPVISWSIDSREDYLNAVLLVGK